MVLAQLFHIGNMDWAVNLIEAAIWIGFSCFGGFRDLAHAFDNHLTFGCLDQQHGAALAFVVTSNDFDLVAFFDVGLDAAHGNKKLNVNGYVC